MVTKAQITELRNNALETLAILKEDRIKNEELIKGVMYILKSLEENY